MKNKGYLGNLPKTAKGLINPKDARFYYLRDKDGHPRVTICIGADIDGTPVRGLAFCSKDDNLDKNTGRKIAYLRMKKALKAKKSTEFINANAGNMYDILDGLKVTDTDAVCMMAHKSGYNTRLVNKYEEEMVADLVLGL